MKNVWLSVIVASTWIFDTVFVALPTVQFSGALLAQPRGILDVLPALFQQAIDLR